MRFTKLFSCVRSLHRGLNCGRATTRLFCSVNSPEIGAEHGEDRNVDASKKGLVLGVYGTNKKLELTPIGEEVDQKCGGKISQNLNKLSGDLKLGKAFVVTDVMPEYSAVALASIGPKESGYNALESLDETRENLRWGVGAGVRILKSRGCGHIDVDPASAPDAAAEAAELAAWRFQIFKSPGGRKPKCKVYLYGNEGKELWEQGRIRGKSQNWARFLSDMPANRMTPVDLAQAALDRLCPLGVIIEAHDREWIEAQCMRAFLAVAKGSCDTPMFVECTYKGSSPTSPPVLLAAKGVTFDSGGLCLKTCESMTENRGSMAGAAVVLAAIEMIATLKVPINVSAVIPICENMVSGQCMKVGDVVKALNGLSIQIENTDMEGRLMMADALVYGQSLYKPSLVIDVATFTLRGRHENRLRDYRSLSTYLIVEDDLTQDLLANNNHIAITNASGNDGVLMATGGGAFGCFSNSDPAWDAVQRAGAASGDRPWRFPLWQYFQNQITNDRSVDLRNKGSGHATPCLGAAFLKNFICGDWVHMDITGVGKVAHSGAPPYLHARRMTGRPARTLAALLHQLARDSSTNAKDAKQQDAYAATA